MKMIILDRDGVINEDSDAFVKNVDEFNFVPGSVEAIARLTQAGYRIAVATNQSGLARGYFDLDALNAMHAKLHRALNRLGGQIDVIAYCPHGPKDKCRCRKPLPGMLEEIALRWGVQLEGVPVVGDSLRDLEAALAVGAQPILVETGKGRRTLAKGLPAANIPVFSDLAGVVDALLGDEP